MMSTYLSTCACLSIYLSIHPSTHPPIHPPTYLPTYQQVRLLDNNQLVNNRQITGKYGLSHTAETLMAAFLQPKGCRLRSCAAGAGNGAGSCHEAGILIPTGHVSHLLKDYIGLHSA